ncbi:MAG: type III restriction endonuclease subunit R, partial [Clostridia bacterium]|nr:type III restriction endonuclease subunit R [Clostridia bacterium]
IRDFATSDHIRIMVMTVQSFNKDSNVINRDHERTNGLKPLEFIRDTNPIVIIDEPQSTISTQNAKDAVMSLNPLCTLGYSATHKDKYNLMYRLDAIDAYQKQLVKQIEVASIVSKDHHNDAYLKLVSVDNKKSKITARIEIDRKKNGEIKRDIITFKKDDDLFEISGGREQYSGYQITEIYTAEGSEYVDFSSKDYITLGEVRGELNDDVIKRMQIKKTIEEHLDKELRLTSEGIKVLSLFFIDKVANYRSYDEEGNPRKGKYALWFEEEYKEIIKKPKYRTLFNDVDIDSEAEAIHNGYFAQDRKGKLKDTNGNTLADEDIYGLIMKDKERLLSFDSKLKFIFSHSALKEGWDNPNVFQICTLNETKSEMKKRQEIGRGLRIAVDQNGKRKRGFNINTLTVMANESYEDFVKTLQKEIEEEEGIKFGIVEKHSFANITVGTESGGHEYLNQEKSEKIWSYLKEKSYIDVNGKVTDSLKADLKDGKVKLPEEYKEAELQVIQIIKKIAGSLNIKNADDKQLVKINKRRFLSPEFKELWDRVKYKTTFSVNFDTEELVKVCSEEIKNNLRVDKAKMIYSKAKIEINKGGAMSEESDRYGVVVEDMAYELPDIITYLQNETKLTRKTIVRILKESEKLGDFKNNPQKFMDEVSSIIQRKMNYLIVDGIKYEKLGDDEFYAQELFKNEELFGYLTKNMIESEKSVYEYVVYDSDVEEEFAKKLEGNNRIKVYAKLPSWFKIETPIGDYNPDWAVLVEKDNEEKLYFVIETKGDTIPEELRKKEDKKIRCGIKHFEAIGNDAQFQVCKDFNDFIEGI